jgi:hypothetical protein
MPVVADVAQLAKLVHEMADSGSGGAENALALAGADVAFGSFSTEPGLSDHVRFTPGSDRTANISGGPVRANRRHASLA